jgi:hypothetical protein
MQWSNEVKEVKEVEEKRAAVTCATGGSSLVRAAAPGKRSNELKR